MFSAVKAECLLTSNMASSCAKLYAQHTSMHVFFNAVAYSIVCEHVACHFVYTGDVGYGIHGRR